MHWWNDLTEEEKWREMNRMWVDGYTLSEWSYQLSNMIISAKDIHER